MTTLKNRPRTALLVVDMQRGVIEGAHQRDAVVANIGSLVEKARREQIPVIWVQHSDEQLERGSDNWRIVPELTPGDAEALVEKNFGDSFEYTRRHRDERPGRSRPRMRISAGRPEAKQEGSADGAEPSALTRCD